MVAGFGLDVCAAAAGVGFGGTVSVGATDTAGEGAAGMTFDFSSGGVSLGLITEDIPPADGNGVSPPTKALASPLAD